ncbi:hypothetical protein L4D76_17305 [Photobacterium sagamiensis]|uniref:hypothetical protein n=1 Tax=Photobacterium sagamiensis TaxID=2910241 RepID=UPI003D124C90
MADWQGTFRDDGVVGSSFINSSLSLFSSSSKSLNAELFIIDWAYLAIIGDPLSTEPSVHDGSRISAIKLQ